MIETRSYGTCLACTQAVAMTKHGRTRAHTRKEVLGARMVATVECLGSNSECAEDLGVEWDPRPHRRCWVCEECGAASGCDCQDQPPAGDAS